MAREKQDCMDAGAHRPSPEGDNVARNQGGSPLTFLLSNQFTVQCAKFHQCAGGQETKEHWRSLLASLLRPASAFPGCFN